MKNSLKNKLKNKQGYFPSLERLQKSAVFAAQTAGEILRKNFRKKLTISEKIGAGLVTNIDLAAEKISVKILRRSFPEFGFLTEEAEPEIQDSPGRWIIDPLDGTTNYIHGFPMFCVSIAAEWEGEVVVGVIYHPILKETYIAAKGKGSTVNGKKIHVSKTNLVQNALLTTGFFTNEKDRKLKAEMKSFERLSQTARAIRRPGSAALDLAYTARGVFDGFWERRLSAWDVAAGGLLVQEAGGIVTDFQGGKFQVEGREILASNKRLHPSLIKEIRS